MASSGVRRHYPGGVGILWPVAVGLIFVVVGASNLWAQTISPDNAEPDAALVLNTDTVAPRRFVSVHGRAALIDGYSQNGLEVWAYPVQLVRGYRLGFRMAGSVFEIDGQSILRRITYLPEAVIRTYIGSNFIVKEKLFVPLYSPGAILTYTVESTRPVDIVVHFTPVLNLMWPASIGGQDANWQASTRAGASGYVLSEPTNHFAAFIGSSAVVAHDEISNSTVSSASPGALAFTVRAGGDSANAAANTPTNATATVLIAAADDTVSGAESPSKISSILGNTVERLSNTRMQLQQEAVAHYVHLQADELQIETPDAAINRDLAWAEIALDQAWVCNPYLGCGIVAGYGPSRGARRPQYAWFFAGDGLVAIHALVSAGEYQRARQALQFITKYQDKKNGMIWHEMSQSAGLIDWVGKYPYMFVHVDITFQYLIGVENYIAVSGDKSFLQQNWPSIQSAYRYCQSLASPDNGLPQIPVTKEGGSEQDRMSDELTLSASWIDASHAYAQMATWMGNASEAEQAAGLSRKARAAAAQRYWDAANHFWIDGYSVTGKPIFERSSNGNIALAEHLFSDKQDDLLLDQLASPNFQTDWGTRSVPLNSTAYDPDSYAKGSVWAVGTAHTASTFWLDHRPTTALPIWLALLSWSSLDSMGHMDEVLAGNYYHEQMESVPEQTWSSAAFFDATVHGLLGLEVNVQAHQIVFAPHLPPDWNAVSVRHIQLPSSEISLSLVRTDEGIKLTAINQGVASRIKFDPEIPLGAQLTGASVNGKAVTVQREPHAQDLHANVVVELPTGTSTIAIEYRGGVSLWTPQISPLLGGASQAVKIIGVKLSGSVYTIDAAVRAGHAAHLQLWTQRKIASVQGATTMAIAAGRYDLRVQAPNHQTNASGYQPVQIVLTLN